MLSHTHSATLLGISAIPVAVEANSGERGDPKVVLVGLPDAAVKESLDRVQSSLTTGGFNLPRTRVTINLAPADLKKEGSSFDLPVALCLLASTKQLKSQLMGEFMVAGELGLSGKLRPTKGALSMALLAKMQKLRGIILPMESAREASIVSGIEVYGVSSLAETVDFLNGKVSLNLIHSSGLASPDQIAFSHDFEEIKDSYD